MLWAQALLSRLAQVRTPGRAASEANSCASKSLILITRSNLIALAEHRGSQLKPDHHSPADAVGRFRTTRWSVVLRSAEVADDG
jgi:hypothetical protein